MSPRNTQQARWGGAGSESDYSFRTLLTCVLVVLLVGIGIGYLVRGAASGERNQAATTSGGVASSGNNNQVAQQTGAAAEPNLGAFRTSDRSDDGAVRAATSYATGLSELSLAAPAERLQVLNTVISPRASAQLRQGIEEGLDITRNQLVGSQSTPGGGLNANIVTAPASYRVENLGGSPDNKRVTIWMVSILLSGNGQRVESAWSTNIYDLAWEDHWRLVETGRRIGPAPQLFTTNAQFSTFNEVLSVFNGFKSFRYAPASPR